MKIRMRGDSLRLRLTQSEVQAMVDTGVVEEVVAFGPSPAASLHYLLKSEGDAIQAMLEGTRIVVRAPEAVVRTWAMNNESVGFEATQDAGNGHTLRILVEKDFACLVERPHETNADAFPNPNTSC